MKGIPLIYLDKEQSESIKGILIVLIVFGHNHVLCPNTESGGIMEYLYTFHVASFFILPFFYQSKKDVSIARIGKTIVRNWVPYFWTCLVCWIVCSLYKHNFEFGRSHVLAFFQGTQTPIQQYFGFVFPWFLPTYCTFSLLLLFARRYRWVLLALSLLGVGTFFMSWEDFYQFKNVLPFGIGLALNYFVSGVMAFYLNRCNSWVKYGGAVGFVVLSVCWWLHWSVGVLMSFMPTMFFLSLLLLVPYVNTRLLRMLGRYSLGIYLIHMFLVNITYLYFPHTLLWGWITFLMILFTSLGVTIVVYKLEVLRKIFFPASWKDFKFI